MEGPYTSNEMHRQVNLQGFARPLLGMLLPRSYQSFFLDVTCYGIVQDCFTNFNTTTWYTAIPCFSKVIFLNHILPFTGSLRWLLPFKAAQLKFYEYFKSHTCYTSSCWFYNASSNNIYLRVPTTNSDVKNQGSVILH